MRHPRRNRGAIGSSSLYLTFELGTAVRGAQNKKCIWSKLGTESVPVVTSSRNLGKAWAQSSPLSSTYFSAVLTLSLLMSLLRPKSTLTDLGGDSVDPIGYAGFVVGASCLLLPSSKKKEPPFPFLSFVRLRSCAQSKASSFVFNDPKPRI